LLTERELEVCLKRQTNERSKGTNMER
jgi:hypothetical protein